MSLHRRKLHRKQEIPDHRLCHSPILTVPLLERLLPVRRCRRKLFLQVRKLHRPADSQGSMAVLDSVEGRVQPETSDNGVRNMRLIGVMANHCSTGELSNGVKALFSSVFSDEQIKEDENAEVQGMNTNSATDEVIDAVRDIWKGEELTFDHNYVRVLGAVAKTGVEGTPQESIETYVAIEGLKDTEDDGMSLDTPSATETIMILSTRKEEAPR
ncbi:unnamed protein product [Cuscuta epithymum]|uniref:Uncharacterized protein n=1 Tax=Cuscuta epithymum TaxID=186058 RepID=A0AAV0EIP5_9ASTE|nr:unnamed protein product [Cuscuta epithymum]